MSVRSTASRPAVVAATVLLLLGSCTGLDYPQLLSVQVLRASVAAARPVTSRDSSLPRVSPSNAKIAFTKIWYPTKDTAIAIMNDPQNTTMSDFTSIKNEEAARAGSVPVLDTDAASPLVFDLDDPDFALDSELFPEPDTVYPGVIVETLYYEFALHDFSIRWYTMGDGTFERGDILVKTESMDWQFAYCDASNGKVQFFDTRQTIGSGLSPLVGEHTWSDWDQGGTSGLLPANVHYVYHNDIESANRFNSMFFASGNAPLEMVYTITYNLDVEYGGMEYSPGVDADGDGVIEFDDLTAESTGRTVCELVPITGAIEYNVD